MNHPSHVYYHQAQGQGPMAAPGGPPGYFPQVAYGMLGGERPGYPAATAPPPYPSPYYPIGMGPYGAYPASPAPPPAQARGTGGFFNFGNERFVTGILAGAAVTFLLTNETVQRAAIKSAVKVWLTMQGGFEELSRRSGNKIMILTDMQYYLAEHKHAAVGDLALHFGIAPDAMRGMLDFLARKGKVHPLPLRPKCRGVRCVIPRFSSPMSGWRRDATGFSLVNTSLYLLDMIVKFIIIYLIVKASVDIGRRLIGPWLAHAGDAGHQGGETRCHQSRAKQYQCGGLCVPSLWSDWANPRPSPQGVPPRPHR